MTDYESQVIIEAIKRNAPKWYDRLIYKLRQKQDTIQACIDIACNLKSDCYQGEVNRIYTTCCSMMNKTETYMLNYICLIKHKEQVKDGILKDDADIQRWIGYLQEFRDSEEHIIRLLDKQAQKLINQYKPKNSVGRPKGKGKQVFIYNGQEYHTIQECANDYGISKQGMHKRLRKLNII